jgi:hypothetical protein
MGHDQLLAYADDVNVLRDNIDTIEKNTDILIDASKEVGLYLSRHSVIKCYDFEDKNGVRL